MVLPTDAISRHLQLAALAKRIYEIGEDRKYRLATSSGLYNIVYVEGLHANLQKNDNATDRWNDLGLLISVTPDGTPFVACAHECTTAPGLASIRSEAAIKRGGVARVPLGEHLDRWIMGVHKSNPAHPALQQHGELFVHRDLNQDGQRHGDKLSRAYGINQHSTRPNYTGEKVGTWSAGCLVRRWWNHHEVFLALLKSSKGYKKTTLFSTWLFDVNELLPITVPGFPA